MSNLVNDNLFELAGEHQNYWEGEGIGAVIQADIDRNDLEGLQAHLVQSARLMADNEEISPQDYNDNYDPFNLKTKIKTGKVWDITQPTDRWREQYAHLEFNRIDINRVGATLIPVTDGVWINTNNSEQDAQECADVDACQQDGE